MFNKLTNATQLIDQPYSILIASLADARESGTAVKKTDISALIEAPQADEFIEQAIDLGIIELTNAKPA